MSNSPPYMIRQGDILVVQTTDQVPADAKPRPRDDSGRVVLAYGEVTGHAHAILDPDVELLSIGDEVEMWLKVNRKEGATLVHEEHASIHLPQGIHRVVRQREYTPEAVRRVED